MSNLKLFSSEKGGLSKQSTFDVEGGHGHSHAHTHGHSHIHGDIAMVGWMVIFGDALHNFADGLGKYYAYTFLPIPNQLLGDIHGV